MPYSSVQRFRIEKFLYRRFDWQARAFLRYASKHHISLETLREIIGDIKSQGYAFISAIRGE